MVNLKKIGSAGLLLGGLLSAIGGIGSMVSTASLKVKSAMNLAVLGRVGAIISFVFAIIVVAAVCMAANSKKGGAIASMIFGVFAFVAQFLINPLTSMSAAASAGLSSNVQSAAGAAVIGLILLAVSGIALFIMGIVGLVSKNKPA